MIRYADDENAIKKGAKRMQEFHGIFPYLVSPVDTDGSIRERVLRDLVEHLIQSGVQGLTPLGSTGEFFYLNWQQRRRIVEIVLDQTAGRVPVVAGVGCASVHEGVYQAAELEKMGADGILGVLNVYFPLNQDAIYEYYSAIAHAVSCQVVLYNNPRFSGFEISIDTLKRLGEIENVNYYKDASSNTGRLLTLSNALNGSMKIFSASAHVPTFIMLMGGAGWMAGPACIIPRQSVQLYELCRDRRWEEAMQMQRKLWLINDVFQKYGLAGCIKAGLTMQGFDVGDPIPPLQPVGEQGLEEIRKVLTELGAL